MTPAVQESFNQHRKFKVVHKNTKRWSKKGSVSSSSQTDVHHVSSGSTCPQTNGWTYPVTLDIHPRGMSNFRLLVMLEELVDFWDINNDRMVLPGFSDSLLPYSPPPNHSVCASIRLQTSVFPPGLGTSKGVAVHLYVRNYMFRKQPRMYVTTCSETQKLSPKTVPDSEQP